MIRGDHRDGCKHPPQIHPFRLCPQRRIHPEMRIGIVLLLKGQEQVMRGNLKSCVRPPQHADNRLCSAHVAVMQPCPCGSKGVYQIHRRRLSGDGTGRRMLCKGMNLSRLHLLSMHRRQCALFPEHRKCGPDRLRRQCGTVTGRCCKHLAERKRSRRIQTRQIRMLRHRPVHRIMTETFLSGTTDPCSKVLHRLHRRNRIRLIHHSRNASRNRTLRTG